LETKGDLKENKKSIIEEEDLVPDTVEDINAFLDLLENPIDLSLKLTAGSHCAIQANLSSKRLIKLDFCR
jgi:uncharacterized protein (DUF1778 family)